MGLNLVTRIEDNGDSDQQEGVGSGKEKVGAGTSAGGLTPENKRE